MRFYGYAECHFAVRHLTERHIAECHFADCHFAQCRCRCTFFVLFKILEDNIIIKVLKDN